MRGEVVSIWASKVTIRDDKGGESILDVAHNGDRDQLRVCVIHEDCDVSVFLDASEVRALSDYLITWLTDA